MISKQRMYEIIFEADTRKGRQFDIVLIVLIIISIALVMLDSLEAIRAKYQLPLKIAEWVITVIFTIEYFIRIWLVRRPFRYIFSLYGIIDLLAILPSYLVLFISGGQNLIVVRAIRLLRVFRILKLTRYMQASRYLALAMFRSREKILIFLFFILTITVIFGTLMYLIEGEKNGFKNIPTSIYWAIVTLTTVGYGDISPVTGFGQFLASIIMILGYSIIAVPTGIVTSEMIQPKQGLNSQVCDQCLYDRHDDDAQYCKKCGTSLFRNPEKEIKYRKKV